MRPNSNINSDEMTNLAQWAKKDMVEMTAICLYLGLAYLTYEYNEDPKSTVRKVAKMDTSKIKDDINVAQTAKLCCWAEKVQNNLWWEMGQAYLVVAAHNLVAAHNKVKRPINKKGE